VEESAEVTLYLWLFRHETGMYVRTIGVGAQAENRLEEMKRIYFVARKQFRREIVRREIAGRGR
jgi:hypothetical protein